MNVKWQSIGIESIADLPIGTKKIIIICALQSCDDGEVNIKTVKHV